MSQTQRIGTARVRRPHGAEADEGVYDCMWLCFDLDNQFYSLPPFVTAFIIKPPVSFQI